MFGNMTPSLFSFGRRKDRHAEPPAEAAVDARPQDTATPSGEALDAELPEELRDTLEPAAAHSPRPEGTPGYRAAIDVDRATALETALETWRQELVDLGGVASQDDITVLDGVVDLTAAHPSGLAQLYAGRPTQLSSLVRERSALSVARRSLREVAARTEELTRTFGVAPVYLAIGVASWSEPAGESKAASASSVPSSSGLRQSGGSGSATSLSDAEQQSGASLTSLEAGEGSAAVVPSAAGAAADQPFDQDAGPRHTVHAPVLLRPVQLTAPAGDAELSLAPSVEVNPVISRILRAAGCEQDVEAIARGSLTDVGFTPRAALARIASLGRQYLPDFELHERLVVGAFVHPGQALVEDFDAVVERSRRSALVAALAGDEAARSALAVELPEPIREDRDPAAERGIGDLDVAQLDAIEAVSTGASFLLDAPPGSDVAATLAAILADAAASGRTVLHVPASGEDAQAVADVLAEAGLSDMVVDLTNSPNWRAQVAEAIKESLGVQPPLLDVPLIVSQREELTQLRGQMRASMDALHRPREPWNVSAYEALQQLAEFTSGRPRRYTTARVHPAMLTRLDESGREEALLLLHRAHSLELLQPQVVSSAWQGITVTDIDEATDALRQLTRLADELVPTVEADVAQAAARAGLIPARSMVEWEAQLRMLEGVRESLDIFVPEVFERSAADMIIATATRQWREERSIDMNSSTRRRFLKQAKDLVRPGRPVEDLHAELVKVQLRREEWQAFEPNASWPLLPPGLDEMRRTATATREAIDEVQPLLASAQAAAAPLEERPFADLLRRVRDLADDDVTAQNLPEVNRVMNALADLGLGELVTDLAQRAVREEDLEAELTYCWWTSILSYLLGSDPDLVGLESGILADRAGQLRQLDAAQTASLAGPVAQAYAVRVREAVDADRDAARALYLALSREESRPLVELLAEHPMAFVVKPIWIVPATLVSQVFDAEALVELAIIDACMQVPVSQVLPAFVRAEQVLVVGDPRRESSGVAVELGSLLPRVTLPTTRNTLDASIASFLATHGYEGVLEPIVSPPGHSTLELELVDGRGMPAPGQTAVESVPAEVDRVVDRVIDHALVSPEQSLAVVALNERHAEQIRRAVSLAVAGAPALVSFFEATGTEPFLVTDLRGARSLRRDRLILSVGYAKTPHGRTIHSFGAVAEPAGLVGLVEALCVARYGTHVISCLAPQDIDPDRLHAPGAQLLREVLVQASGEEPVVLPQPSENSMLRDSAQPGVAQGDTAANEMPEDYPDPLLVDLAERLWRKGLTVKPRYGLPGSLRIPLAIGHPDYPEEMLVAVLTDNEDYIAEPSLRRRDRHWVERLEQRGWHVYSTNSVSVFVDPEGEAAAIENIVLDILREREAAAQQAEDELDPVPTRMVEADAPEACDPHTATDLAPELEPERSARPPIAQGLPLQAYSDDQLDDLVAWIRSDRLPRSVEEEVEELRATLALRRRGASVDAVLTYAVTRTRPAPAESSYLPDNGQPLAGVGVSAAGAEPSAGSTVSSELTAPRAQARTAADLALSAGMLTEPAKSKEASDSQESVPSLFNGSAFDEEG